jgi:hypothetical protein
MHGNVVGLMSFWLLLVPVTAVPQGLVPASNAPQQLPQCPETFLAKSDLNI